jgi:hypothetical protein
MRKYFVLVGVLVMIAGSALAQEFPKVETSPAFMFIRSNPNIQNLFVVQPPAGGPPQVLGSNSFNCAGGGGTIAYNLTSMLGIAADMGGCKYFGTTIAAGSKINGSQFVWTATYLSKC